MAVFRRPDRVTGRGQVGPVLHEAAGVAGLPAAVGEHHGEIGNEDCAEHGYHHEPAQVIDEHNNGDYEADGPDAHHQQVPALPEVDVVGPRTLCLRYEVHVRAPMAGVTHPHPSTVCPNAKPGHHTVGTVQRG